MGSEGGGGGAAGCIREPCGEQAQANRVTSVRTARADTEIRIVTNYSLFNSNREVRELLPHTPCQQLLILRAGVLVSRVVKTRTAAPCCER